MKNAWGQMDEVWKLVWRWSSIERIRIFLWLVANDRLHASELRFTRLGASPDCKFCGQNESVLHVLRDSGKASIVWQGLVPGNLKNWDFSLPLRGTGVVQSKEKEGSGRADGFDDHFWCNLMELMG